MTQNIKLTTLLPMVEKSKKDSLPHRYPEFAARLLFAMKKEGVNVSVTDIKTHLSITYEMARRYTLGQAIPRAERMDSLAELVKESPSWLAYGVEQPSSDNETNPVRLENKQDEVDAAKLAELVTLYVKASPKWKEFILGTARDSKGEISNHNSRIGNDKS